MFQHAEAAFVENDHSLKLETIRNIISEGRQVKYYIMRHNLDEKKHILWNRP